MRVDWEVGGVGRGSPGAGMVDRRRPVIDAADYIELPEYM